MKICIVAAREQRNRCRFLADPLTSAGHDIHIIRMSPFLTFLFNLMAVAVSRSKPKHLILMGVGGKGLLSFVLARITGIGVVVRLGGDYLLGQESRASAHWVRKQYLQWLKCVINKNIGKQLLRRTDHAIVVNDGIRISIANALEGTFNADVVPQYCEGSSVRHDYALKTPIDLLTVSNFAFLEKANGVIWLIDQVAKFVDRTGIAAVFRVAGGGMHLENIRRHVARINYSERLEFKLEGFVTNLEDYYIKSDVFLYQSTQDGTPNVILEAKKFGIPMIVNDCMEFRQIVKDQTNGLMYRNADEFQICLARILADESLRRSIGQAANFDHDEHYSAVAVQKRLESVVSKWDRLG